MKPKLKQYILRNDDTKTVIANSPKQALRKLGFKFGTKPFHYWRYLNIYPAHGPVQRILVYGPNALERLLSADRAVNEIVKPNYIVDCLEYNC